MSRYRIIYGRIFQPRNLNYEAVSVCTVNSKEYKRNHSRNFKGHNNYSKATVFTSALFGAAILNKYDKGGQEDEQRGVNAGDKRPELPTYSAEDISKHDTKSSFWVTYRHGVYDITKFLPEHPGGEQILNAGGHSIEPFWNVYGMHKTEEIFKLLEQYRIGNLNDDDVVDHSGEELWVKEPVRDKRLVVKTLKPFNAEIPPTLQINSLDTPNELFYVRQHMPVPEIDAKCHSINVIIKGGKTTKTTISLDDMNKFNQASIRAALMCAGNRRSDMNKQTKPVKGISWAAGAVSCAVWGGVYLRDVLLACGVDEDDVDGKHIVFEGSDIDATGVNFSTSIPLYMGLDRNAKILLATKMNGETLPLDHGYPLRVIVPGAAAVRSVKWLQSITVSEDESQSHWHLKDYRGFNPSKTWETADFSTAPPIYTLPVTSAICDPLEGQCVEVVDGHIEVKGYAYSGGGAKILRVDISADEGKNWVEAEIIAEDAAPPRVHYSWLLWRAFVPVPGDAKQVQLQVKATDSNFNTQPEKFEDIWNIRGVLSNAYHKINIQLQQ